MITAGKYIAKAIEAGMSSDSKGNPRPFIRFKTEGGEDITWYGSITSAKAEEIAIEAVMRVGFTGKSWTDFGDRTIDMETPVQLDVREEMYKDKKQIKVAFINRIRSVKVMDDAQVMMKTAGSEQKFDLWRAKNKASAPKPSDDVPF